MKFLKGFILVILAIILFAAGWVYFVGMGAERTVLSPAYYRGILEKVDVVIDTAYDMLDEQLTQKFQEDMQTGPPGEGPPEELPAVLIASLIETFDRDWLKGHLLAATDNITAWAKGDQEFPAMAIDLREKKQEFQNILKVNLDELAAGMEMPPPPGAVDQLMEEILREMDLPDEMLLGELVSEQLPAEVAEKITLAQNIRTHFLYAPYILFALILLLNFLLAGIAGGLKWFGITALISGSIFTAGLYTSRFMLLLPNIKDIDIPVSIEAVTSLASYTLSRITTVPLIFAGAGLLLLVAGIVLTKVKRKSTEQ